MKPKFYFNLKNTNDIKETLVLFGSYISAEKKKFVFSTGLKVKPSDWDNVKYRFKDTVNNFEELNKQLIAYEDLLLSIYNTEKELITRIYLKQRFALLKAKKTNTYNDKILQFNSLSVDNLINLKLSIEKILKKDRTIVIEQCYQEVLQNLTFIDKYVNTNKTFSIGSKVILHPEHPNNRYKKHNIEYTVQKIKFNHRFQDNIGYQIKPITAKIKPYYVSRLQIFLIEPEGKD